MELLEYMLLHFRLHMRAKNKLDANIFSFISLRAWTPCIQQLYTKPRKCARQMTVALGGLDSRASGVNRTLSRCWLGRHLEQR